MSGFALHPEAFTDIDDIAIQIAQDSAKPDEAAREALLSPLAAEQDEEEQEP